jgi:predicted Fe-Mo cluster-binding NifX family protein
VSCAGTTRTEPVESRFGRARYFLVVDTATDSLDVIENLQNRNAAQGAGIQSAQAVVSAGATALVTGHCGPKAFKVLQAAGVAVHLVDACTVDEALRRLAAGELPATAAADVEGHW